MIKKIISVLVILILVFLPVAPAFAADLDVQVNSSEGGINFRTGPSRSSQVMFEIPDGTVLHVTDLSYNAADDLIFGLTSYNGSTGWISLRQTIINRFSGFNTTVASTEGSINFRASASRGSSVITEIPNGTSLYISDMYYNAEDDLFFGMTTYNGVTGWISLRQTSLDSADDTLLYAQSYASTSETGSTSQIQGSEGTLSVRTDVGFNGVVTVKSTEGSTNFRSIPSTSSSIICELPNNTVLTIYDIVRNEDLVWGYTEYNGIYGWVSLRQTATPMHEFAMPDYIRDWDGSSPAQIAAVETDANSALYRNYSYNYDLREYENCDYTSNQNGVYEYDFPEARIRFTAYDVGQPGDYPTLNDWPHYAVIEHYDEDGETVWSITTDSVYRLNGGYSPLGASEDTFFYTNIDAHYAIDIETGVLLWTVPNPLGGYDGGFHGRAVGKAGEVYICATNSGRCMVINAEGEVVYVDGDTEYIGPNMVFTDISYASEDMISVITRDESGRTHQFKISSEY